MLQHSDRPFRLLINYFVSDNEKRQEEIDFCVAANSNSPYFKTVTSIGPVEPADHPNVTHEHFYKRPNYRQLIEYCNRNFKGDICLLANIDITFDDSILLLEQINWEKTFAALTRWENKHANASIYDEKAWNQNVAWSWGGKDNQLPKGSYHQDVWAFRSPLWIDLEYADMTMGYMGCEHRIASLAKKAGYRLINPARSVKSLHWHDSDYRTYDRDARLDVICPVEPTFIEDII